MRARSWLIVGGLTALPPACVGSCTLHDELLASRFETITTGMERAEVIKVLGQPHTIEDCAAPGPFKPWHRQDCVESYLYPSWGVPLLPSVWVVWLNDQGTVIDKYRFVSW